LLIGRSQGVASPRRIVVDVRCGEGRHGFLVFDDGAKPVLDHAAMREASERIDALRAGAR